jgi:hypothetical protein
MRDHPSQPASYRTQSPDTTPEAERVIIEALRQMPVWRKAEMLTAINRAAQEWTLAGLRARYPEATEAELRLRLGALRVDRQLMIKLFGWDPAKEGY